MKNELSGNPEQLPETFTCTTCKEVFEVSNEPYFKEPIYGRCGVCWEDFESKDSEEQFEEAMDG